MKSASALVMIVVAVFLLAPPASALVHDYYLTNWNVIESNTAGDKIHAQVDGPQVTFTRVDGNSLDPAASDLESIWYTLDIHTNSGSSLAARYTTTDSSSRATPATRRVWPIWSRSSTRSPSTNHA